MTDSSTASKINIDTLIQIAVAIIALLALAMGAFTYWSRKRLHKPKINGLELLTKPTVISCVVINPSSETLIGINKVFLRKRYGRILYGRRIVCDDWTQRPLNIPKSEPAMRESAFLGSTFLYITPPASANVEERTCRLYVGTTVGFCKAMCHRRKTKRSR